MKHAWKTQGTWCYVICHLDFWLFEGGQDNDICSLLASNVKSFKHAFLPPRSFLTNAFTEGWPCQGQMQEIPIVSIWLRLLEPALSHALLFTGHQAPLCDQQRLKSWVSVLQGSAAWWSRTRAIASDCLGLKSSSSTRWGILHPLEKQSVPLWKADCHKADLRGTWN